MTRALLTLLSDFGLVVLIWIVQLIIYPSFHMLREDDFGVWHKKYMRLISYLAVPLMLVQVMLHAMGLYEAATVLRIAAAVCVAGAWGGTFTLSVPCHNALAAGGKSHTVIQRLVRTNWLRTGCWSLAFLLSLMAFMG